MSMGTNNTKTIDDIFDRMDQWRHLPSYQLERRADIFFSLYLSEVLEEYLEIPINPEIIPEFPLRFGTLKNKLANYSQKNNRGDNHSFKMDYLAISEDGTTPIFVELKTNAKADLQKQEIRLDAARKTGFIKLLEGAKLLFASTPENRKYYYLFEGLENLGLVKIPSEMKRIIVQERIQGIKNAVQDIEILFVDNNIPINAFIIPLENQYDFTTPCKLISFKDFKDVVKVHPDPISKRFARSLDEWQVDAGKK